MTQQIERDTLNSVRPDLPYTELSGFEVLTDDERAIQQAMHAFARDVMRPTGIAIDKLTAEQAIAPNSPYWEFMATAAASGIEFDTAIDGDILCEESAEATGGTDRVGVGGGLFCQAVRRDIERL